MNLADGSGKMSMLIGLNNMEVVADLKKSNFAGMIRGKT